MAEEEAELESDPEEAKLSLNMRRKEASDDDEEGGDGGEREREKLEKPLRVGIDSDGESDCQQGAADYDDEELVMDEEEEEYYEEEEVVVVEEYEERNGEIGAEPDGADGVGEVKSASHEEAGRKDVDREREADEVSEGHGLIGHNQSEDEEDNEPFAVPTAGAFYMHDDRFRDNSGRPHRRAFGGSKLWELKNDGKWGHDKFEEMNMQERYFEEWSRSSRGYNRGRGKARGGFPRGSRSRASDGNNHKNIAPKTVRGRGPRRYQPLDSEDETPTQHKRLVKSLDRTSPATSTTNAEPNPVPVKKAASNLSSASPPFYPFSSSNKEITLTQNRDVTNESANRIRRSIMEDGFTMQQNKNVSGFVVMDKLHIDGSFSAVTSKQLSNLHMPTASSSMIANQTTQSRGQGKDLHFSGPTSFQPSPTHNQVNKVPSPSQIHASQRNPIQSRRTTQLLGQHTVNLSEDDPPKSNLSVSEFEPGDSDSTPESVKSKTVLVGKGKGMVQGSVRAPFLCGGALVMESGENVRTGHDDQKFPASPAFLPVMQFRGQHPGGMGVPNVGMAFQRYVAQPQHSSGNSEMTWLPVLTGAAGALGTAFCSPYFSVAGAYPGHPNEHTSSLPASSKNNGNTPGNEWKPEQRSELLSDAFSQRQNKPRRYSEMNFGQ